MTFTDPVALVVGAVLLLWGRKLYWLALGGLGFFLGHGLAREYLELDAGVELAVAVAIGVAGALLAVVAQKIAVTVGGLAIGGFLAYYLALPWAAELGVLIWGLTLVGAVLGVVLAALLFEAALIVVSSLVGATLITQAFTLARVHESWVFLVLLVLGVLLQSRGRQPRRRG